MTNSYPACLFKHITSYKMLSNITLSGFKSISQREPIELTPYTMLCGSNSSGKSSLIQSILMLSQTFGSRFDQDSVVLNGHLVRLGSFRDIKTHIEKQNTIDIGFTLKKPFRHYGLPDLNSIHFHINFGHSETRKRNLYSEANFHPPINSIKITITRLIEGVEKVEELFLRSQYWEAPNDTLQFSPMREMLTVEVCTLPEVNEICKEYPNYRIVGCERATIIPTEIYIEYDLTKKMSEYVISLISNTFRARKITLHADIQPSEILIPKDFFRVLKGFISQELKKAVQILDNDIPKNLPKEIATKLKDLFGPESDFRINLARAQIQIQPEVIDLFISSKDVITISDWLAFLESRPEREKKALSEIIDKHRAILQETWYRGTEKRLHLTQAPLRTMHHLSGYLSSYFSRSVKYLGPLRNEPQAVYSSLGHNEPKQVGLKGEFTAAALHINQHKTISYPSPIVHRGDHITFRTRQARLIEACQDWLQYLGVLVEYKTIDRGKLGYEIYVKTTKDDLWQDLTHVGVGVSQVLPIVLMALLSDSDNLLIFEQPELHLHPKVQSRLCDFFIAMTSFGRQCLVETHSEYLINRLRRRIVQSRDNNSLDNSSIFFVTKRNGLSNFDRIEINRFGAIPDWPEDFFDQTDLEVQRILLDATTKRKEEKKEGNNAYRSNDL